MDPPKVHSKAFRSVFCQCLEIEVKEEVVVPGKMIDRSRTYGEHAFPGTRHVPAIHLGIRYLFEIVSVHSQTQAFWNHFIG